MQQKFRFAAVIAILGFTVACGNSHMPGVVGNIPAPVSGGDGALRAPDPSIPAYDTEILPIIQKSCKPCHGEGSANGNWLVYENFKAKAAKVRDYVFVSRIMPKNGVPISDENRKLIADWVDKGAYKESANGVKACPAPAEPTTPVTTPGGGPLPTYEGSMRALIQEKCVLCHTEGFPFGNWSDEATAKKRSHDMRYKVFVERTMPMVGEITDAERQMFADWADSGAK